jgi:hypothetical protein
MVVVGQQLKTWTQSAISVFSSSRLDTLPCPSRSDHGSASDEELHDIETKSSSSSHVPGHEIYGV